MGGLQSKNQICKPVLLKLVDKKKKSGILALLGSIDDNLYEKFYEELVKIPENCPIDIIINTQGGPALWCSKICYVLYMRSGYSRAFVYGCAHSAGTIIALSTDELYITYDTSFSAIDAQGFPLGDLFTTSINKLATLVQNPRQSFIDLTNERSNYFREMVEKFINNKHNKELIMQKMHDQSPIHEQLFFKPDLDKLEIYYHVWDGNIKNIKTYQQKKSLNSNLNSNLSSNSKENNTLIF
jgi:ATP-dependent protease ClpP protease subunit